MPRFLSTILQKLNAPIYRKIYGALDHVNANRQIEAVNTLIIGDLCTEKVLKKVCHLDSSLKIMFPNRSLVSSKLILYHLTSVLMEGGDVVIIDKGGGHGVTCYDYPFLSQITRLELNMKDESKKRNYPLLFAPLQSIKLLFGFGAYKIQQEECPDEDIIGMCKRKKFKLTYLKIK